MKKRGQEIQNDEENTKDKRRKISKNSDHISTYKPGSSIFDLVKSGDVEMITSALRIDPNRIRSHDDMGKTALHFAASIGNVAICQALIDNEADVDARTHDMLTPLHMICSAQPVVPLDNAKAIVRMLLDKGANFSLSTPNDESTINVALNAENEDLAVFLLGFVSEDVIFHRDNRGETCAHLAAQLGNTLFIKEVSRREPRLFLLESDRGTALHVAITLVNIQIAIIIMDTIRARYGVLELRTQINKRREYDDLSPTALAFIKESLVLAEKCIEYGGIIDKPFNSAIWNRPSYCYEICFEKKNVELFKLVLNCFGDEPLPGKYDPDSNAWILCVEYGADNCLIELDKRQKRPKNGFESVDWNHHRYTLPWCWAQRRFFSDLQLQGVSLLQKFMRENIPRTPVALSPIQYQNFPFMLDAILRGESLETIQKQLREEFLFSGPFLDWDVVKQSFARHLEKWPFDEQTQFERYKISLFDHMAQSEADSFGAAREMMKLGLQLEIRKCPCKDCECLSPQYACLDPNRPEISLALNAADYFLRIPMCHRMRYLFKQQKDLNEISSVATLEAHARYALRKTKKPIYLGTKTVLR
ncbi:unnamed protein product, partial [Mesorhabditis belari]|uniref:Uncharacterized protein n=1 Tax=Mesorhabditis belari TaxID=2138241 RepID=A0AAF3EUP2_9BILA